MRALLLLAASTMALTSCAASHGPGRLAGNGDECERDDDCVSAICCYRLEPHGGLSGVCSVAHSSWCLQSDESPRPVDGGP